MGIGSCWIGMIAVLPGGKNFERYAKRLVLPAGYLPQFGMTLVYKALANLRLLKESRIWSPSSIESHKKRGIRNRCS
jgi:hypothetical protein